MVAEFYQPSLRDGVENLREGVDSSAESRRAETVAEPWKIIENRSVCGEVREFRHKAARLTLTIICPIPTIASSTEYKNRFRNRILARSHLKSRVDRDQEAARQAQAAAQKQLSTPIVLPTSNEFSTGATAAKRALQEGAQRQIAAWHAIAESPFHAMVEVEVHAARRTDAVWYAHQKTNCNEVLDGPNGPIHVLSWTHPGFQIALAGDLGEEHSIERSGYTLKAVRPTARARFRRVLPEIRGLYEPGGEVRVEAEVTRAPTAGLKPVKLEMTRDQVQAFIAKMYGFMIVSGEA